MAFRLTVSYEAVANDNGDAATISVEQHEVYDAVTAIRNFLAFLENSDSEIYSLDISVENMGDEEDSDNSCSDYSQDAEDSCMH